MNEYNHDEHHDVDIDIGNRNEATRCFSQMSPSLVILSCLRALTQLSEAIRFYLPVKTAHGF
jgi:hypothetical protein